MKEKVDKGNASANLGRVLYGVGNYGKAIDCLNIHLKLAKEKGDKAEEGDAYCNLGIVFHRLGDFHKAIHYHKLHLSIAKEMANKHVNDASKTKEFVYTWLRSFWTNSYIWYRIFKSLLRIERQNKLKTIYNFDPKASEPCVLF